MKIVGKEEVSYISKKTNEPVKGFTFHCLSVHKNVEGQSTEKIFISARSDMFDEYDKMPIGAEISVSYNRWGTIEKIQVIK